MELLEIAKRVKRGVRLLDKLVPKWRLTLRKHADTFDLNDTEHCILGTLEHHNGRMRVLRARKVAGMDPNYYRGIQRLGLDSGKDYGFDGSDGYYENSEMPQLQALWRAEFEK